MSLVAKGLLFGEFCFTRYNQINPKMYIDSGNIVHIIVIIMKNGPASALKAVIHFSNSEACTPI